MWHYYILNNILEGGKIFRIFYANLFFLEYFKGGDRGGRGVFYSGTSIWDDWTILLEGRNSLSNLFNILEKLSKLNDIKVNKKKVVKW